MSRGVRRAAWLLPAVIVLGGCSNAASSSTTTGSLPQVSTTAPGVAAPPAAIVTPATTTPATTAAPTTNAPTTNVPTTVAPATTARPTTTPYVLPVPAGVRVSYAHTHGGYTATDIFATTGCGTPLLSPVNGQVLQTRRVDNWTRRANNPALRGGLTVAILGDDGVRYYLAHFQEIEPDIQPGADVNAGEQLGQMGESGDAGACHLHFGISIPCPGLEWSVRRGVVWPWPYLDSWRSGGQLSPQSELTAWAAAHPDACATAMADEDAAISG